MIVAYLSLTGQTRNFVKKLGYPLYEISWRKELEEIHEPFLLILPSYDYSVTKIVDDFVDFHQNLSYCKGVCGGGNRNFAQLFCFSAKDFSSKYQVPLVHCFEFRGTENDVSIVKGWIEENE